jgi:UDP-2,3-diacylglucosamine pyrophosphatase LpxH
MIKRRIATAWRFIQGFENRVAERARADGFDGHICGHIHYAQMREHDGALYLNDGDWVEHCTTLVEHRDGAFELLHWTEQRLTLARRAALVVEPVALPAAA